jgi:transcriptional regulator with XRE-family HTH domain
MADRLISSTVQAWELGLRLRAYRERLGLTAAVVGKTTGIGSTNVSAIESGKRRLTEAKLRDLVAVYEPPADDLAELEELRAHTDRQEWWYDYGRMYSDEFLRLLGLEAGADKVYEYAPDVVPGLLQTADYARAMIRAGTPYIRPVDVGPRLETRLARQTRLEGEHRLKLDVVLGEAALRQWIGGQAVTRRQLAHLLDTIDRKGEHVRIRVMPFTAGPHPLISAPLTILSFPSVHVPDVVWQETAINGAIVDKRQVILEATASYAETFDRALDEGASRELIAKIHDEMEQS